MTTNSERLTRFIELSEFTAQKSRLGITDADVFALQDMLIENPEAGDVIKGAGGFRKIRVASTRSTKGKSGSFRVIYLVVRLAGVIFLGTVYGKSEKTNLSPSESKAMAGLAEALKDQIKRGHIR